RCRRPRTSASRPPGRSEPVYGESSAAGTRLTEDFPHLGVRIARETERKPGEIGHELIVGLGVHLVLHNAHTTGNLILQMLYPLFRKVGHFGGPEAMARKWLRGVGLRQRRTSDPAPLAGV